MLNRLIGLWKDEDGPTMVEYALVLVLVSIAAVGAFALVGSNANTLATTVANHIVWRG